MDSIVNLIVVSEASPTSKFNNMVQLLSNYSIFQINAITLFYYEANN